MKMWDSLELPKDLLNGFGQNAGHDMNNEVQSEVISDVRKILELFLCFSKETGGILPLP